MLRMIGITGVATSGKDTLCILLKRFFLEKSLICQRFALADELKKDLKNFILEKFNINIENCHPLDKKIVRPILVAYGKVKRNQTFGRYWIEKLKTNIQNNSTIPIVTDIRYDEYPADEFSWLKKENGGILIHISRIQDGKFIPPANEEEKVNDEKLKAQSDYQIVWCTENNQERLYDAHKKNFQEIHSLYERYRTNNSN
jgi:hypothetical protein